MFLQRFIDNDDMKRSSKITQHANSQHGLQGKRDNENGQEDKMEFLKILTLITFLDWCVYSFHLFINRICHSPPYFICLFADLLTKIFDSFLSFFVCFNCLLSNLVCAIFNAGYNILQVKVHHRGNV